MNHVLDVPAPCHNALRANLICNNPILECQSRIGMSEISNERSYTVCLTVFGMNLFRGFSVEREDDDAHWVRLELACFRDSIPSRRLIRIQISNPSKRVGLHSYSGLPRKRLIARVF